MLSTSVGRVTGGFGFFLRSRIENTSPLRFVCPVPCLGYGIISDAILIDSPYKIGITRDAMQR